MKQENEFKQWREIASDLNQIPSAVKLNKEMAFDKLMNRLEKPKPLKKKMIYLSVAAAACLVAVVSIIIAFRMAGDDSSRVSRDVPTAVHTAQPRKENKGSFSGIPVVLKDTVPIASQSSDTQKYWTLTRYKKLPKDAKPDLTKKNTVWLGIIKNRKGELIQYQTFRIPVASSGHSDALLNNDRLQYVQLTDQEKEDLKSIDSADIIWIQKYLKSLDQN